MPDESITPIQGGPEPTRTAAEGPAEHGRAPHPDIGRRIGSYKVLDLLGEGGMGVVYLAEQEKPRRKVALKVVRPGLATQDRLRRFEHEAQVLGRLQHPAIAQIYEAGTADTGSGPQPYFAMELVHGVPLTEYAEARGLGTRARLELFAAVCDGVQHAHQKGLIHRDLKPGNILVTEEGQPKILDFGVARAIDSDIQVTTLHTDIGQLIGTIPYMSPEQASGDPAELDTRSDVYALGVVGYELLAGRLPYDIRHRMIHEAVRVIRENEPTPLSSVNRVLGGDVETIIAKALEKDKSRRYQSAGDLASDIHRYLTDEPIFARPPSAMYQLSKFAKRNKALVGGVAAVFVALLLGIIGTTIGMAQAVAARDAEAEQRRIAEAARRAAQDNLTLAEQREQEATQARDNLQVVVDFQSSMLSEVDAERMGRAILDHLRNGIRESPHDESAPPEAIASAMATFDSTVKEVNATDLALKVIDEHVLSRATETVEKDFAGQPLVEAALRQTVADTYRGLGLYSQAMPQQERALETRRRVLGDDHPETLISIGNMGTLLSYMGKLAESKPYFREALEGHRRVLGNDHSDTLISISNMGFLLQSMGKLAEAEPYYREALEGLRRVLGDDHPETLRSMNNMGFLLQSMGKPAKAEPYFREALERYRRVLGEDHPDTLRTISNMGSLLDSMGKLAEAEPYFREALEGRRRVLGDDHPSTLISISNMGHLLQLMGKLEEAQTLLGEAVSGARRSLPADHWRLGMYLARYGGCLTKLERYAEAEAALLEANGILEAAVGAQPKHRIGTIESLVELYESWGKPEQAAEWRVKLPTTQPAGGQP